MKKFSVLVALSFATPVLAQETAQPLNLFPEGSFEVRDGTKPEGWKLMDANYLKQFGASQTVETETIDGKENHFFRTVNGDLKKSVWAEARIPLDSAWKKLRVRVKMRVKNLAVNSEQGWYSAQWDAQWLDKDGKYLKHVGTQMRIKTDTNGWVTKEQTLDVLPGATYLMMNPGVWGSSGTLDLDDIQIYAE